MRARVLFVCVLLGWLACNGSTPTVTAPDPSTVVTPAAPPQPIIPTEWHPSRGEVLAMRANFVGPTDAQGATMFDIYLPYLTDAQQADWVARKRSEGLTHVVLDMGGACYPGDVHGCHGRLTPEAFAQFVVMTVLDTWHLVPVIMTTSDGTADERSLVASYLAALNARQRNDEMMLVPCFECAGPALASDVTMTPGDVSAWLDEVRSGLPGAATGLEPAPTTDPHPWVPDNFGGRLDALLYESPHGHPLLDQPCDVGNPNCWLFQWQRVVQMTQRPATLDAFELCASDLYHHGATEADCHRLTNAALTVCPTCGWGNGSPQ